jgi:hypothetical protein
MNFLSFIDKKAYSNWKISEVLKKFLHQDGSSIGDVCKFKIGIFFYLKSWFGTVVYDFSYDFCITDELQKLDSKIAEVELKLLIDELKKKKYVVQNESTCQEFISALMTTAVKHVQLIEGNLELSWRVTWWNLWLWSHWLCYLCWEYNCISCKS